MIGSKQFRRALLVIRQFGIATLLIGGVLFLNKFNIADAILTIGGLLLAFSSFLTAFRPIHEEPNWELVYPELALGHPEVLDLEIDDEPLNSK